MYRARINDSVFEIGIADNGFLLNGKPVEWDVSHIGEGYFHIIINDRGYRAEVVRTDEGKRNILVKINGRTYPVVLMDKFDVMLEKMGMNAMAGAKINQVRAPMPGLILSLKVREGDRVTAGDPLIILEAMKMENIIKAPGEATVKSVKVRKGDGVEKNQVLIEFNPA